MNLEALGDFGIIGIAVVLILREVFAYLKHRDTLSLTTGDGECEDAAARLAKIDEQLSVLATSSQRMCTVLEQTDSRGLPLVYRDGTLTEAIAALGRSIEKLEVRL
jgi:hypothetical protein